MENIKVKNIIIGKHFEDSENLHKFFEIVNRKKIIVNVVLQVLMKILKKLKMQTLIIRCYKH